MMFQMCEIYGQLQGKMMAKLWLVNWTPAALPLPALELSLKPDSPLFHTTHQLEPALGNWAGVFSNRKTECVLCLRGASLLPIKMGSSMLHLISESYVLSLQIKPPQIRQPYFFPRKASMSPAAKANGPGREGLPRLSWCADRKGRHANGRFVGWHWLYWEFLEPSVHPGT